ncbi:MAG: hypothetical protein IKZ02_05110 [Alphaproteobacteria bacterium]|nr:hypothetical protein [Alphaproteobacteria bacterium]
MKIKVNETGRSMVEMLGTLAIIAVLSVAGIMGYKFAMMKYVANLLVQEAHLAYINEQGASKQEKTDWTSVNFTPKCGYNILTGKDVDGDIFVLVKAIDNSMCNLLMQLGNNDHLSFYQQIAFEKTNYTAVTECTPEPMDIVFAFEESRAPGKNCETNAECVNWEAGYCNMERGVCQGCLAGTEPNSSGIACNPICNTKTESECWKGETRWCCGGNTICGDNLNECKESDGFCRYSFKNMKLKAEVICPRKQYCYLAYTSKGCNNTVGDTGNNPLWGVCLNMENNLSDLGSCPIVK